MAIEPGLPNTYDLKRFQDIHLQDAALYREYISRYQSGAVNVAHNIIETNSQMDGKAFTAKSINAYVQAILDLENKTIENGTGFLEELLVNFQTDIDNFVFSGEWAQGTEYKKGNFVVSSDDKIYLALKDTSAELTDSDSWLILGLQGDQGVIGFGLNYRGRYNSASEYNPKDMVVYQNGLYVSKTTNTNITPGSNFTDWCVALTITERGIFVSETELADIRTGDYFWQITDTPSYDMPTVEDIDNIGFTVETFDNAGFTVQQLDTTPIIRTLKGR